MIKIIAILLALAIILIDYIYKQALKNPESKWAQIFTQKEFGPKTDIAKMTKKEIIWSGIQFIILAIICFAGAAIFIRQLIPSDIVFTMPAAPILLIILVFICTLIAGIYLILTSFKK